MAWCLRFVKNDSSSTLKIKEVLIVPGLKRASDIIVSLVQESEFKAEILALRAGKNISSNSRIIFLDNINILHVGRRLRNANIPENQKHQAILPKKHHMTKLLTKYSHETHLHGGTSLTILAIQQKYWIINCRDEVRKVIRNCMKCFRNCTNTASQIMTDLPAS
ncbi:uncharacterized protein LOC118188486 [Stegodyphus dumicola]|uniref:uncharacterized protein LOC118188486 n=1 Tax=Stegodyphus dumicola TaxID=202533 RepID=UPI0015B20ACC|nr:uncharacterized protein LOC118188486 [Stegodyphus dumicola]